MDEKEHQQDKSHSPAPGQHSGAPHGSSTNDSVKSADQPNEKQSNPSNTNPPAQSESEKKGPPGGFDNTPLPDTPPGYTVKITFHRATALPIADAFSLSSDPYVHAELYTDLPTRHKEDPPLRLRTRTIFKNTAPTWNESWIVGNIPATGFKVKARIYDEDRGDADDRLGNVHITVGRIDENWEGISNQSYKIKKRMGSKRAYLLRALAVCTGQAEEMSGYLHVSVEMLGRSSGDHSGRAYTIGPNYWCKHYSPLLGRIAGSKTTQNEKDMDGDDVTARLPPDGEQGGAEPELRDATSASFAIPGTGALQRKAKRNREKKQQRKTALYSFEAHQMQLKGPVPAELYHRYVEFKPFIRALFTASGIRGILLAKALHHQHAQVYNFNPDTKYGVFKEPCESMTHRFLDMCHYDEGGRIFTYVLSLDALLRFTETGKEFGIDMLSKHTMHSDASSYIAYSGEFFIRRRAGSHPHSGSSDPAPHPSSSSHEAQSDSNTKSSTPNDAGITSQSKETPNSEVKREPASVTEYELFIDNDSGTYRPKAALLPLLRSFLSDNFPGLKIVTLDCKEDEKLMDRLKGEQREAKKKANQGPDGRQPIYTQAGGSSSSLSSSDVDRLERREDEALAEERSRQDKPSGTGGEGDDGKDDAAEPAPSAKGPEPKHRIAEAALPFVKNAKLRDKLMTHPGSDGTSDDN